ncbi:SseB family protein [Saccharopolyspora sp. NFXS83]|uniref:SseB family protein n=1 Tax=Saccharopolyspora sp. NFXS83 TaxID=2993560 RepID=UPI00224B79E9|nr:SseB family protein [Saccharopolyspora sp. NFXS83]MCX2733686.1 SseB family protein [Saccharopolyspora sp. NFXS83]
MGNDDRTRKNAGNALASLHKGLGVRRADLHTRLGPELRGILRITGTDATGVREQLTRWLEEWLAQLADSDLARIAAVSYNIPPSKGLNGLNYGHRVEALAAEFGRGFSKRSIERRMPEIVQHLQGCLDQQYRSPKAPKEVAMRQHEPLSGDAAAPQPEPERGGVHDALRALHDPRSAVRRVIDCFLADDVHVPCSPAGGLVAIRAAGRSTWVCAFTRAHLLEDYRRASSAPWATGSHRLLGADLVRTATRTSDPMGILLNPRAGEPMALTETVSIPPALTAEIRETLRST